jgi:hypothetical protein
MSCRGLDSCEKLFRKDVDDELSSVKFPARAIALVSSSIHLGMKASNKSLDHDSQAWILSWG